MKDIEFNSAVYSPHNFTVNHPRAFGISKRIEKAIALNVSAQFSSQPFQVHHRIRLIPMASNTIFYSKAWELV